MLELVDGTKVVVPDSLDNITSYVLQEQGDWFEDEIKFLRALVKPGDTVVDIGANYGVYALSLAKKVGSSGQVWAFEPATSTAELLAESASANRINWLKVRQQALSNRQGTAWLQMPGQSELNSLASLDSSGAASEAGPGEEVPVTTLDACLEQFGWSEVDVLKIDAEGEEERIILGGMRFFEDLSPLVMFEVKAGIELHLDLVDRFQEIGYQCFYLIPGLDALAPFDPTNGVDGYLLNLFAAKPDRIKLLAAAGKLVEDREICEAYQVDEHESWSRGGKEQPYVQRLWQQWLATVDQPEQATIRQALAAWRISQDGSEPIARRYGALTRSFALLHEECQIRGTVTRWASLARVALALGQRQQAMQSLSKMLTEIKRGKDALRDEPFLCPDPHFDTVDPANELNAWLEAAGLSAVEQFGSYSGFFTGASAAPNLERLSRLGFDHQAIQKRIELVQKRFGPSDSYTTDSLLEQTTTPSSSASEQPDESSASTLAWFQFLGLEQRLRCIDVGALTIKGGGFPCWEKWAHIGCAEVLGFEPLQDSCDQLNAGAKANGAAMLYFPWALGDGNEHTLYITNEPMTTSLFKPARSTVDLFPALGSLMQVVREEAVQTHRLDAISEAHGADFIKIDTQGAELMILQNAQDVLRSVSVVQCEVEFVELYEGQPLMAEVDTFLRSQGFVFHRFSYMIGRPFMPLRITDAPLQAISQNLWGDAIYVRDFRHLSDWNTRQLKAASFLLHELYNSVDLVALLLAELDQRFDAGFCEPYLGSLLFGNQQLSLSSPQ
ncbi:FkbM family methyltransferase [Cyanobium sp. ULC065]